MDHHLLAKRAWPSLLVSLLAGAVATSGCSTAGSACLQTPVSSKLAPEAVAPCEQALTAQPDRRDLFLHTVELLRVQQRYGDIVTWSKRALEQGPERTEALFYLAYGLRLSGRCDEALVQYQAFAAARPQDPDPHFGMALCWQALGQPAKAIVAFQTYAQKERRQSQAAWVRRAQEQITRLQQGAAALAAAETAPGSTAQPAGSDSAAAATGGRSAGAPAAVMTGLAAKAATVNKGASAAKTGGGSPGGGEVGEAGKAAAACVAAKKSISADPFDTAAYDRYAACAAKRGQHDEIVRQLRVGLRDNPDYHRGWLHLGRALKALGQAAPAQSALAKACAEGISEACGY